MPQFEHDRASVHYEVVGEGPPLLLIAGIASDSASWGPLLPLLGGRKLILVDNRASGRTTVDGPVTLREMADDCAALLLHLELGAVDVVGHSLGGHIAFDLAGRYPNRVRRLVTLTSGAISAASRVLFRDMARLYFIVPPQDWFRLLYQWLFSDPFFADDANVVAAAEGSTRYAFRQSPGDFARQVAAIDDAFTGDRAKIAAPVLAVAGDLDLLAPPRSVVALHEGIADIRVTTIAGAAHSIHWEKPAETAAAINDFLR